MLAADALSETLGVRAAGDKTNLRALVRTMAHAGLAPVLIKPDSKEPFCPLPARTKGKADADARETARLAGQRRWEATRHDCGKYHVVTPENATRYLGFAERTYGVDTCNLALNVGMSRLPDGSRLVVVDADQSAEVAAFLTEWQAGMLLPTVVSPGKIDADGTWAHKGGGHYWFTVPPGVELPERMGTYTSPAGWVAYWGQAYVLVPPSVRPEGPYRMTGAVHPLPEFLHRLIWQPELAWRKRTAERVGTAATGEWSGIDAWAAVTPWADILEPDGWTASGAISVCGCDEWTAPGPHGSPKSATAHDLGCGQFDDTPGHNPLHVWTDNPPDFLVQAPKTVTKLQYIAWRDHGGEISGAIGALGLGTDGPALLPLFGTPVPGPSDPGRDTGVPAGPAVHGPDHDGARSVAAADPQVPASVPGPVTPVFTEASVPVEIDRSVRTPVSDGTGHGPQGMIVGTVPDNGPAPGQGRGSASTVFGVFPGPSVRTTSMTGPGQGVWRPFVPDVHRVGVPDPTPHLPYHVSATGTRLPVGFWDTRPLLKEVRRAAEARMCSPDAVLHALLITAAAAIPHTVRVANSLGDVPLSLYTVLCGGSGSGKTAAVNLAGFLFGDELSAPRSPLPSAEGVAEAFMGVETEHRPHPDDDTRTVSRRVRRQVRHNALFHVDEAESLAKAFARQENAIGGALRQAWSGALLGNMNASEDRRRIVARDSYHLGLIVGAQPAALGFLVGETMLGTAQRFLFAEAEDPAAVDHGPGTEVGPLHWAPPGARAGIVPEGLAPELPGGFVMRVAPSIDADCRAARLDGHRGHADEQHSQRPVMLLKLAGVLAYLDGRDDVAEGDWELARCLYDTSAAVRRDMVDAVADIDRERHQQEADRRGAMAATVRRHVETAAQADQVYSDRVHAVLAASGPMTLRTLAKHITAKHRHRAAEFLDVAVARGLVVPAGQRKGSPLWAATGSGPPAV